MLENECVRCGDNEAIDGFLCFGCGVDIYFGEETIFEMGESK